MDEVIETTNEAAEDVNVFIQYLQDHIPNLISFAIEIVLALIFFFLGRIMIKWFQKQNQNTTGKVGQTSLHSQTYCNTCRCDQRCNRCGIKSKFRCNGKQQYSIQHKL